MLPLENFGHCCCHLPLVFSCHCITIIFVLRKATSVSITVRIKTNVTGCHDLLWQVVTFRIPPRWKRFFVSFCMVWKQLRSWMWQFSNNMSYWWASHAEGTKQLRSWMWQFSNNMLYWWASHAEGTCGFPQEGCLQTGGHCAKLRPIQGACGKTGPSALCTNIQHCTRPAPYVSQWHSWACQSFIIDYSIS